MHRVFTLRLRPNKTQIAQFEYILDYNCETYNAALQERKEAWKLERKRITYFDQCQELAQLRKDPNFQIVASEIQRDPLCRVNKVFIEYFKRCKLGKKSTETSRVFYFYEGEVMEISQ